MRKTFIGMLAMAFLAISLQASPAPAPQPVRMPGIPTPHPNVSPIVQPTEYAPHLAGPVPEGCLAPDTMVCPGAPVVLNAVLVPPPMVWVGKAPLIRFEVVEGRGTFGTFETVRLDPPGWFDRLLARMSLKWKPQKSVEVEAIDKTGSAAAIFYPLGDKGETVRLRAVSADPAKQLGSVEYVFQLGEDRSAEMQKAADQGLVKERALEKINFHWVETLVMSSPRDNLLAKGRVDHYDRVYSASSYDTINLDTGGKKSAPRPPYDLDNNPYVKIHYWGETAEDYIGSKGDPEPPGHDGSIMLYYYNKQTGLMQEMRAYSFASCVHGFFLWNKGTSGYWFSTQILKKTWSPVHDLWEDMSLLRDDIRILQ